MRYCSRLTQRLCQSCCCTAVENIMNLILQVHNSCKQAITAHITLFTSLLVKGSITVACCSKPHSKRPVQSKIQHIKPECSVGLTPEPCEILSSLLRARGWNDGWRRRYKRNSLHIWLLFGLWFIGMRFYCSTAGTILTKGAVAVHEVATSPWGCVFCGVKAAVSEIRLQYISLRSRGGKWAACREAGQNWLWQAEAHLTDMCTGLWENNWLAAQWASGETCVWDGMAIAATGMIAHSNVCNLKNKES